MSDALQLILNGLVQAIVQHPAFKDALSIALDSRTEYDGKVLQNLAQRVVILETRNDPNSAFVDDAHKKLEYQAGFITSLSERLDKLERSEAPSQPGNEFLFRRLDELEARLNREDDINLYNIVNRVKDLESFDLDEALDNASFRVHQIDGLEEKINEEVESLLENAYIKLR